MEKGKIKAVIVVALSVVAFVLLLVAIATDYWISNKGSSYHIGLFYDRGLKILFCIYDYKLK